MSPRDRDVYYVVNSITDPLECLRLAQGTTNFFSRFWLGHRFCRILAGLPRAEQKRLAPLGKALPVTVRTLIRQYTEAAS